VLADVHSKLKSQGSQIVQVEESGAYNHARCAGSRAFVRLVTPIVPALSVHNNDARWVVLGGRLVVHPRQTQGIAEVVKAAGIERESLYRV
jgi:hypothetical protein